MDEKQHILSPNAKRLLIFWARMLGWVGAACIAPIVTFAIKFGLFNKDTVKTDSLGNVIESSSTSLNGWGIVSCVIVWFTISAVMKEIIAAYPGYSLTKQWLIGFRKTVLPLAIGFFICLFIRNAIQHLMFCLGVVGICQFIAIPLNPLPKWRYEKSGIEDYGTVASRVTDFVKRRKDTSEKEGSNNG